MNPARIALAALGAMVVYFGLGSFFFTRPTMRMEFSRYPAVYRSQQAIKTVMPFGMLGMLLSMAVLAVLFAMIHPARAGAAAGAQFGALIGVYAVGSFVLHNHVNLNIGARLTLYQAVAYFVEWTAVGIVIALIYRGPGS
jgi:hypothetical protein